MTLSFMTIVEDLSFGSEVVVKFVPTTHNITTDLVKMRRRTLHWCFETPFTASKSDISTLATFRIHDSLVAAIRNTPDTLDNGPSESELIERGL
mmetsp:Transcript_7636/g.22889  ORF Transcript_7636/g.22889 Transcript_7636/m.22889 type:complete len:94 (-) Transcript_7636:1810-2091(-)